MKRIILSGCNGKMGHVVTEVIQERDDCQVVAGLDRHAELKQNFPVVSDPSDFGGTVLADVLIDFSHPSFLHNILQFAVSEKIPAMIATTGLSDAQHDELIAASREIPVFYSVNMSLGVNLMNELVGKAAGVLNGSFDIEVVEAHHNKKVDAPSGTAKMLAETVASSAGFNPTFVYGRHGANAKRSQGEIGIHSIRGGTIAGEHEVIFAGDDEIITIKHTALSKRIFAVGAVNAAMFLIGKPNGYYNMQSLLDMQSRLC